jgi:hypothetical protein
MNYIVKVYNADMQWEDVITYLVSSELRQNEIKNHLKDIKNELYWENRKYDSEEFENILNKLCETWLINIEKATELEFNLW